MLCFLGAVVASLLGLGLAHRLYRAVAVEWRYAQTHKRVRASLWLHVSGYMLAHVVGFALLLPCFGFPLFDLITINLIYMVAGPPSIAMLVFLAWTSFVETRQGTIAKERYRSHPCQIVYRSWKALQGTAYVIVVGMALFRVMTALIVLEHVALIGFTGAVLLIRVAVPKARYVLSPRSCKTGRALRCMMGQPLKGEAS